MFLNVKQAFPQLVREYEVLRLRESCFAYEFVALITFCNDTQLHVKDYLFADGTRKYAYHWQQADGSFIARWDNAAHWRSVASFPHHVHRANRNAVEATTVRTLYDAMQEIQSSLGF